MGKKVTALFFSATGTTKKIVLAIADTLSNNMGRGIHSIDFTLPGIRQEALAFAPDDIVVIGVPVYAGRVPNVLLKYLNSLSGNGALAIAVVVYGNRNYDDALIELTDILELNSFKVIAGGAFIGEHSFSKTLAQNRPDEKDMAIARDFANRLSSQIAAGNTRGVVVKGNKPYRSYYRPKNEKGEPVDIRKVTPKTYDRCTKCKLCVDKCPVGSIDSENPSQIKGICIKCGACIKICPVQARYYDDNDYLRHKYELEVEFADRREPELFL